MILRLLLNLITWLMTQEAVAFDNVESGLGDASPQRENPSKVRLTADWGNRSRGSQTTLAYVLTELGADGHLVPMQSSFYLQFTRFR